MTPPKINFFAKSKKRKILFRSFYNSALFEYLYSNFDSEMFLGHITTFLKILSQIRKQRLKMLKKLSYLSVLDSLWTPIFQWTPNIFS